MERKMTDFHGPAGDRLNLMFRYLGMVDPQVLEDHITLPRGDDDLTEAIAASAGAVVAAHRYLPEDELDQLSEAFSVARGMITREYVVQHPERVGIVDFAVLAVVTQPYVSPDVYEDLMRPIHRSYDDGFLFHE
jgi:hypothetical protein